MYDGKIFISKRMFLQTGNVPPEIPLKIRESWIRSRRMGVDSEHKVLPGKPNKDVLTNQIIQINARDAEFYNAEAKLLEKIGAAIVFTDEHFDIFAIRGNVELKNRLREINFRFGYNLAESNVGTNALALSYYSDEEVWVYGAEHYMDILSGYVCAAHFSRLPGSNRTSISYPSMLIIPKEMYNDYPDYYHSLFSYILFSHIYRHNSILNPNYFVLNALSNLFSDKNIYYIALDKEDNILDISSNLLKLSDLTPYQTIRCSLSSVFPLIKEAEKQSAADKNPVNRTGFKIKSQKFKNIAYGRRLPVSSDNSIMGYIILISTDPAALAEVAARSNESTKIITSSAGEGRNLGKSRNFGAQFSFDNLVGSSQKFENVVYMAKMVAKSQSSVLILGESGTGKELFAQSIHNASSRHEKAFVSLNCAAMPRELIDSELFGYVEGAFTGARKDGAPGKIELADGGTLFLDEIGDMPLDLQVHLLKVIEDKKVTRLGDSKQRKVDIRIIAATNQNLKKLVDEGKFRLDLYYRLNVFSLQLPPLRERDNDIVELAEYFRNQFGNSLNKSNVSGISEEVIQAFMNYSWPGNLRELRNAMEYAMNLANGPEIMIYDIPPDISAYGRSEILSGLPCRIEKINTDAKGREIQLIQELMQKHKGNKSLVAADLGISRPALYRRLKKYENEIKTDF